MSDDTPQPTPLTPQARFDQALAALPAKRRKFVIEYLRDLNGTQAAIRAGYAAASASVQASQILSILKVREAIDAGMDIYAMPAGEILLRLTRIARGSIADVLRLPPASYAAAQATLAAGGATPLPTAIDSWAIDLVKAQQTGAIDLVKTIKETEHGPAVEMYSAHEALRDLAKIRGLAIDRKEISGPGGGAIPLQQFTTALETAYADDDQTDDA